MRILQLHLFCAVVVPLSSCECQEYSHRGSGYSVKGTYMAPFNASFIKSTIPVKSFLSCALMCIDDVMCVALNYGQDVHDLDQNLPKCEILLTGDEGGDVIYRSGFYHFVMRGNITTVTLPSTTAVPRATTTQYDQHAVSGYVHHINKNCYSNDLPPVEGMSVNNAASCAEICNEQPLCNGFAYSINYNYCWIKSVCSSFTYLSRYVSYAKI